MSAWWQAVRRFLRRHFSEEDVSTLKVSGENWISDGPRSRTELRQAQAVGELADRLIAAQGNVVLLSSAYLAVKYGESILVRPLSEAERTAARQGLLAKIQTNPRLAAHFYEHGLPPLTASHGEPEQGVAE